MAAGTLRELNKRVHATATQFGTAVSGGDRLARLRLAHRGTWTLGALLLSVAALWAVRADVQPRLPDIPSPPGSARDASTQDAVAAVPAPLPGFALRFSPRPPPAPLVLKAQPTEAPIAQRLQLLGIARDGERLVAALYDPDENRVHLVGDGETVAGVEVRKVEDRRVLLARGDRTRMLALRTVGADGGPASGRGDSSSGGGGGGGE